MRLTSTTVAAAAVGAGLVTGSPVRRQTESLSPCANITQQYQEARAANATSFFAEGQVAYDCLMSMPINSELASAFIIEVKKYLEFQSTIPVLANPPESYLSPAVDLLGGLDAIYQKANTSQYQSQYQLDTDLNNLLLSAHDGHLNAGFCATGIFDFGQQTQIVSVSTDGLELPLIYTNDDAALMLNGSTEVSDVVQINGMNSTEYVEKLGLMTQNQDPDAQWNNVFPSRGKLVTQSDGAGVFLDNNGLWPGASEIVLTFRNGSTFTSPVYAAINLKNFNYTDGESLFNDICVPATTESSSGNATATSNEETDATSSVQPTYTSSPRGYPESVIRDPYNTITGYYLEDEFNDTAVMLIPTFETSSDELPDWEEASFSDIASLFVNGSIADGKTKMIIDLSGNPGGSIASGFDLFKLFFPDLEAYSATRMRDHEAEQLAIKALSNVNPATDEYGLSGTPFAYQAQVSPDQNSTFSSWEEFYGPDNIQGANMSSLFANFNFTANADEEPIRGYGGVPLNVTGRPFEAENILVITDGFCQSTCTTFVTLMTLFGNVSSLAFGGRPINQPMQIMGGVRGAQSALWTNLQQWTSGAYENAVNASQTSNPTLSDDELVRLNTTGPIPLNEFPLTIGGGNLNLRNAYTPDDVETPLQFVYQAADCKLFYTYENIVEPGTTWVAAANAWWGNGTCVDGSTSS